MTRTHPMTATIEVDADSVRVVAAGAVLWTARMVAPGVYEAQGTLLPAWGSTRDEMVGRLVAASWRRMGRSRPTIGEVRDAWDAHLQARRDHG